MQRVIMRAVLALVLSVSAAACATSSVADDRAEDSPATVRERLAESTRLFIGRDASTGSITARRRTADGWIAGDTALVIESGELVAQVDASGAVTLDAFEVGIAPIAVPEEVFRQPAELSDVRVVLATPATASATWTSDNALTTRVTLDLDLEWSITIDGGQTPLGEQHLPPVTVDVSFAGDGDVVEATLDLAASGELWDWAGLLELTHLELDLGAATTN